MTPGFQVPLANLLSIIICFFIRPLNGWRVEANHGEGTAIGRQILALVWTRFIGAMLKIVNGGKVVGPVEGVISQVVVPDEIRSIVPVGRIGITTG
jgi:hypothetical protein